MRNQPESRVIGIVTVALVLLSAGFTSALADSCFSAEVDSPILLPGGAEMDSGKLTLCVTRELSPVSALHKTYVDGNPVAMLVSHRGYSEGTDDGRPFMMFNRDARGRLHLYGFAAPAGGRMVTYRVGGDASVFTKQLQLAKNRQAQPSSTGTVPTSTVLVSAVSPSNGRGR